MDLISGPQVLHEPGQSPDEFVPNFGPRSAPTFGANVAVTAASSYNAFGMVQDDFVGDASTTPVRPAVHEADVILRMFEDLGQVMFCVKDGDGRYLSANAAFVRRTGKRSLRQVIGRRAGDLFPVPLAASYEAQDRAVFTTGQPVTYQLEIISNPDGSEEWFLTNKQLVGPADDRRLVVISVEARLPKRSSPAGAGLRAALDHARENFSTSVRVEEMARIANMSVAQLERAMRRSVGVTPKQFVQRLRSDCAATLLAATKRPIAEIASACGYYDQSQFTRLFRAATGMTPGAYRAVAALR